MKRVQVSTYLGKDAAKAAFARRGQKGYISMSGYLRYLIMEDLRRQEDA